MAIINANFDLGKFLLDNGADPNRVSLRLNPLFATLDAQWASHTLYPPPSAAQQKTNYLDLLKALLARGADPNVRMGPKLWFREFFGDWVHAEGATPFWRAAQANDIAAMRVLLAAGADPHITTKQGHSPLHVAAGFGFENHASTIVPDARFETVKFLVEGLGADVNARDVKDYTPLHGAALVGDNRLILYLVAHGANPRARANQYSEGGSTGRRGTYVGTGKGDSVADWANGPLIRAMLYPETVALLVKMGSFYSDNCRSNACLNASPTPEKKQQ
jgi:ankyrin repeat protein